MLLKICGNSVVVIFRDLPYLLEIHYFMDGMIQRQGLDQNKLEEGGKGR